MANDVFCCLPFVKVKEMEKTFRDNWISDADILSFCDYLESDLKWNNMWNIAGTKAQNNLSQVNYTLSYALETCVTG